MAWYVNPLVLVIVAGGMAVLIHVEEGAVKPSDRAQSCPGSIASGGSLLAWTPGGKPAIAA